MVNRNASRDIAAQFRVLVGWLLRGARQHVEM